jgi:predicted ATPase
MRIAISGTHCSGKTTLVEELSRALPMYDVVDEPYYLLEEEGHQFAAVPGLEDFELQLDRSIQEIVRSARDSLFDRCPVDFLAYLLEQRDFPRCDVASWQPSVRHAIDQLDLIVSCH